MKDINSFILEGQYRDNTDDYSQETYDDLINNVTWKKFKSFVSDYFIKSGNEIVYDILMSLSKYDELQAMKYAIKWLHNYGLEEEELLDKFNIEY